MALQGMQRSAGAHHIPYDRTTPLTLRGYGVVVARICFGIAWAIAAWLKWQPAFIKGFANTVGSAADGQPAFIKAWIGMWLSIVHTNPAFFAYTAACVESALAICFILGLFNNTAAIVAIIWALIVWSVPNGFGGPYVAGQSTDMGTAFPYAIIALLLLAVSAGRYLGLDAWITDKLGRYGFLASGSIKNAR